MRSRDRFRRSAVHLHAANYTSFVRNLAFLAVSGSSGYGPIITTFMTDATSQRARRLTFAIARPTMSRMDRYRLGEISRSAPM